MVGLDRKCEIAANNVARATMQEMYAQYGAQMVEAVCADMIRHTEIRRVGWQYNLEVRFLPCLLKGCLPGQIQQRRQKGRRWDGP